MSKYAVQRQAVCVEEICIIDHTSSAIDRSGWSLSLEIEQTQALFARCVYVIEEQGEKDVCLVHYSH